ncbi:MAG TPA: hypothetical protein V6C84_18650 [Coleofasciculaceae cyanobacterium]|jgi:hypothetical protein
MTTNGANNGSSQSGNDKQILKGDSILEKLLNQFPEDDQRLILQLMVELGTPADDPIYPLLVAMQYYVIILKEIPNDIRAAADESYQKIVKAGDDAAAKIKSESCQKIVKAGDDAAAKIKSEAGKMDSNRTQSHEQLKALLAEFLSKWGAVQNKAMQTADEVLQKKIGAYQKEIDKINAVALQNREKELSSSRTPDLKSILWQGWIWAGGLTAISLLAATVLAYSLGNQQGREAAVQNSYKAFNGMPTYNFAKGLMNLGDNPNRLTKCINDNNSKCTIWIENPPPQQNNETSD